MVDDKSNPVLFVEVEDVDGSLKIPLRFNYSLSNKELELSGPLVELFLEQCINLDSTFCPFCGTKNIGYVKLQSDELNRKWIVYSNCKFCGASYSGFKEASSQ